MFRSALIHVALDQANSDVPPEATLPGDPVHPASDPLLVLIVDDSDVTIEVHRTIILQLRPSARVKTCTTCVQAPTEPPPVRCSDIFRIPNCVAQLKRLISGTSARGLAIRSTSCCLTSTWALLTRLKGPTLMLTASSVVRMAFRFRNRIQMQDDSARAETSARSHDFESWSGPSLSRLTPYLAEPEPFSHQCIQCPS
jgi:hypothetical protein